MLHLLDRVEQVRRLREPPFERHAVANLADTVAKLHPRGKANEQENLDLRLPQEEDAELCLHAVGFVMRELGWAR